VPVGLALAGLARCDELDELPELARSRYEQVRGIGDTAGEPHLVAAGLEGLARLAGRTGSDVVPTGALDEARALLAQADQVRERGGRPRAPYERAELVDLTERLAAGG
jgi:hypothetical protein